MERLEKELATREAKLAEQAELISALRVDVSETALNAQVAIDDLREDLAASTELLRVSQVIARCSNLCCSKLLQLWECQSASVGVGQNLPNSAQLKRALMKMLLHQDETLLVSAYTFNALPASISQLRKTTQISDCVTPQTSMDLKEPKFGWCLGGKDSTLGGITPHE